MLHASPIRLVVFDLGRVLIQICDGWTDACQRANIAAPVLELPPSARAALMDIAHRNDVGDLDIDGFTAHASPLLGLTPTQTRAMSDAYLHGPFAGAPELLEELSALGITTACLSNTNDNHWRLMNDPAEKAFLPLHRLTHRFASHLVRARKPDARIYEHVERETGTDPAAILFFDDVKENIDSAAKRGWNVFHVDPKSSNPIPSLRAELARHSLLS